MKVLVLADIDRRIENEFPKLDFEYMGYSVGNHIPSTHEEILDVIHEYDILISEFDSIDKEIIDAATKLKLVICCRGGVHTVIDVDYASQKGILVKNTPARNAYSVAEYVIGALINADRNLSIANELVLTEQLQKQKFYLPEKYKDSLWGMDITSAYHTMRGRGLHNIVLGVIGYGNVGRVVVNMALALGITVLIYNDHPILSSVPTGASVVDKDYLLRNSDYVSLHCNNKKHAVVIGEEEFKMMKNGAYFINTARGDLIDEDALIKYLDNGHLSGAILDVTKDEPLPVGSKLIKAKNIFITPHIAGATNDVIQIGTDMAIGHLREYLTNMGDVV